MKTQELFKFLPSEIIMSILSKLPVRTIMICKCVCKSWLHLVENQEFAKLHLSTSLPGLVISQIECVPSLYEFFEVEDGRDVERHDLHYNPVTKFSFPIAELMIYGSVDGLLCLCDWSTKCEFIYICNPVTRDFITIPSPPGFSYTSRQWDTWGFGLCKMTGQYKVVRILLDRIFEKETRDDQVISVAECYVYTLGTGSGWRRLAPFTLHSLPSQETEPGAFVHGNLHWLGCDLEERLWISCFDLETESFRNFYAPPLDGAERSNLLDGAERSNLLDGAKQIYFFTLFALGESLCLIDMSYAAEFVIWLMDEYGVAKSWSKKLVINQDLGECRAFELRPIKVFKDGDILMEINVSMLFYYSSKTKTIQQVNRFKGLGNWPDTYRITAISHTPSFLSLKSFGMEYVGSF